jgi:hypothetical protein
VIEIFLTLRILYAYKFDNISLNHHLLHYYLRPCNTHSWIDASAEYFLNDVFCMELLIVRNSRLHEPRPYTSWILVEAIELLTIFNVGLTHIWYGSFNSVA